MSEVEAPVREIGEALFHALFDEGVYAAYKASLALAAAQGTQLRVVLRTQAPELAALPWETMYDPGVGAYLCQREPLVRHVSVSSVTHPLKVTPPLRILGVVAAPRDQQRLDVDGEKQRLRAALKPLGSRVSLRWVEGGRWADVQRELIAEHWHVLHFVGHGGFDEDQRRGHAGPREPRGRHRPRRRRPVQRPAHAAGAAPPAGAAQLVLGGPGGGRRRLLLHRGVPGPGPASRRWWRCSSR